MLEWDLDFGRRAMAVRGARWCCLRCQAVTDLGWFVAFATTTAFAATTADLPFGRADLVRHLAAANGRGADDDLRLQSIESSPQDVGMDDTEEIWGGEECGRSESEECWRTDTHGGLLAHGNGART